MRTASAAFLVLGIAISLFAQSTGWILLGEYQPWLPIIGLEYGFFLGLILAPYRPDMDGPAVAEDQIGFAIRRIRTGRGLHQATVHVRRTARGRCCDGVPSAGFGVTFGPCRSPPKA